MLWPIGISAITWWLVGYAFAFGTGNGFIGFIHRDKWALSFDSANDLALWFFEYAFCAASAAIISGSTAEHVTHVGFILYCVFFTGNCAQLIIFNLEFRPFRVNPVNKQSCWGDIELVGRR